MVTKMAGDNILCAPKGSEAQDWAAEKAMEVRERLGSVSGDTSASDGRALIRAQVDIVAASG